MSLSWQKWGRRGDPVSIKEKCRHLRMLEMQLPDFTKKRENVAAKDGDEVRKLPVTPKPSLTGTAIPLKCSRGVHYKRMKGGVAKTKLS